MIKKAQRLLFTFDRLLFLSVVSLSIAGIAAIWSTTEGTSLNSYFGKQVVYLCLGLLTFLALFDFDYHIFSDFIVFFYLAGLIVLGLVLLIGQSSYSNKSWINVGIFSFQPSELVKIAVIIALAKYYSELDMDYLGFRELLIGGLIVFIPVLLVFLQGDLGTAVTFLPIYAVLSFLAGIKKKHIIVLFIIFLAAAPIGWFLLRGYQKSRIETVFNPSSDPHRSGYQTIQSEIAIGSGKFLGKGFKRGSQGNLGFLPARHTDFVFAVLAEEKGFVGGIAVLSLFLLVSYRLYRIALEAKEKNGSMIVAGVLTLFLFHVIINLGMVVGLLPIAGIPLPFVSAGGSSLVSYYAAMGLCMSIWLRRYVN